MEKISKKILKKRGVELYIESTECPEVYTYLHPLHTPNVNEFIDICIRAKGLFVISSTLKEYYSQKGVDKNRIHIINMIVDADRFSNLQKSNNCIKYIAYCGNLSNSKDGVDKLIESFAIVVKKHPDVKLYIIGDKPLRNDKTGNSKLIKKLGIDKNIVFTGKVSAEQIPQILYDAQILALSRPNNKQAKYGFPTKLGEYLMTGNPVVVTAVGDIPLFLKDGVSALIASPDDINQFAEKLCWSLEHPVESKKIGLEGKKVAEFFFNSDVESKKLINIINSNV